MQYVYTRSTLKQAMISKPPCEATARTCPSVSSAGNLAVAFAIFLNFL